MSAWLMSIVGVVFLGVMIDIITPEGRTNAFIKSIFAVFVVYIIVSPIVSMLNKNYVFTYKEIELQEDYLDSVAKSNITALESEIQRLLVDKGYECFVEIDGNMWGETLNIRQITIFLPNSVLINEDKHINNCKVITQLIRNVLEVDEEIIVYERL